MARESSRSLPVVEMPQGSSAAILEYTFVTDGSADDLSSATGGVDFNAITVDNVTVEFENPGSFVTDGSDGKVQTTMTKNLVNTVRDMYCEFQIGGYNGGDLISYTFILRIIKRAVAD